MKMIIAYFFICTLLLLNVIGCKFKSSEHAEQHSETSGQQKGIEKEGRWFTYNDKYVYVVGMDAQEMASDPSVNYEKALDQFAKYRINKVRIWVYCWFGTDEGFLLPWKIASGGKHDLDGWNTTYWKRIKDFVSKARDREIIVEVTIFSPNYIHKKESWSNDDWRPVWNTKYNVNNVFTSNKEGHFSPDFFNLSHTQISSTGKTLADYQKALIDKTISELGAYENVYFEICNEFPLIADINQVYPWQLHWASYSDKMASQRLIAAHAHAFSGSNMEGIQYWWDDPHIDILNFHFYEYDPQKISDLLHAVQFKDKIISLNESESFYRKSGLRFLGSGWAIDNNLLNKNTRMAYGMFTSGGYFSLYAADNSKIGDDDWKHGAKRMRVFRDLAESVEYWTMSPVDPSGREYDSLITQGPSVNNWQVLANPEQEYFIYFWGAKTSNDVTIDLPHGDYRFEWYDCDRGKNILNGMISVRGFTTIPIPEQRSWNSDIGIVLIIKRKNKESL